MCYAGWKAGLPLGSLLWLCRGLAGAARSAPQPGGQRPLWQYCAAPGRCSRPSVSHDCSLWNMCRSSAWCLQPSLEYCKSPRMPPMLPFAVCTILGIGGDCAHVKRDAGPLTWSIQCDCSGPVWSCSWQGVLMRCQGILLGSSPTSWLLRLHLCGASCWPIWSGAPAWKNPACVTFCLRVSTVSNMIDQPL